MPVAIHGKQYYTVAERVEAFRADYPDYTIETQLIHVDDEKVIMKALIMNGEQLISTGYAEELRASSNINRTSAVENCESSAVGRALAFFKYAGDSLASADEVQNAIGQQEIIDAQIRGIEIGKKQAELAGTINAIKTGIAQDLLHQANEAWRELTDEEKKLLWVAPSKGGCFTTEERKVMQSAEFREAI
jgi:deoxycytidylate deaminase